MPAIKERLDAHDKQIRAIRSLVQEGMRLLVETRKDLRTLARMQQETEKKLQRFIEGASRGRSSNGHSKTKLDF